MRIAIPVWNAEISPAFDFSKSLLIVESDEGREIFRGVSPLPRGSMSSRVERLRELGVDVLLCGGISSALQHMISGAGIGLIPWKCGPVDEVLKAYFSSSLDDPRYRMPGTRLPEERPTGTCPQDGGDHLRDGGQPSKGRMQGAGTGAADGRFPAVS